MVKLFSLMVCMVVVGGFSSVARSESNDSPWVSFSTWFDHSCALTKAGKAYCWGNNQSGVLGNNTDDPSKVPTPVFGDISFASISTGANHTCGISTVGQTYCWGRNDRAQLGQPSMDRAGKGTKDSRVPLLLPSDLKFSSVSAGMFGTCALTAEGKAYCWGGNVNGEIGSDPGVSESSKPLAVKGKRTFARIYAGRNSVCALTSEGEAYCWGANGFGQFGDGSRSDQFAPTRAAGELTFANISLGELHMCGVTKDHKSYCWGGNNKGKLGTGSDLESQSFVPIIVTGKTEFVSLSAGIIHTCGLTAKGKAWCWGAGIVGQLGMPVPDGKTPVPVPVNTKLLFSSIQPANATTCAMAMDKNIYCWGDNNYGKLGNDSTKSSFVPVLVETP